MQTVSIIGIGRIGGGLAIALGKKGYQIESLVLRNQRNLSGLIEKLNFEPEILSIDEFEKISSDVIFIAAPDSEIQQTADKLAKKLTVRSIVYHTSGALSSDILSELKNIGCPVGSIHPLISVSDMFLAEKRFADAYFAVEGEPEAVEAAEKIVADLGGKPFTIAAEHKILYHAAAVTACGHLVALVDVALEMLSKCGLSRETSKQILLPLIKSTVENLETQTTEKALTGTFARADVETFERHAAAIGENLPPEILEIYLQLGLRSVDLAQKQGANPESLRQLRTALLLAKRNFKC